MKKFFTLVVVAAALLASCTHRSEVICVDDLYANLSKFLGKTITVTGHVASFSNDAGKLVFTGCDENNTLVATIPSGTGVCMKWNGQMIEAIGVVSESICPNSGKTIYAMEATSLKLTEECCSSEAKGCCAEAKEGCCASAASCASEEASCCDEE